MVTRRCTLAAAVAAAACWPAGAWHGTPQLTPRRSARAVLRASPTPPMDAAALPLAPELASFFDTVEAALVDGTLLKLTLSKNAAQQQAAALQGGIGAAGAEAQQVLVLDRRQLLAADPGLGEGLGEGEEAVADQKQRHALDAERLQRHCLRWRRLRLTLAPPPCRCPRHRLPLPSPHVDLDWRADGSADRA